MRATTLRWLSAAAISAGLLTLATRESAAAPGPAHGRLVLTSFLQSERTDVLRNEILEFRFSTPLRKGSVDLRTLQVNAVTPEGAVPAVGARIVKGNVVRFDPRRTQRNYEAAIAPNSTVSEADHYEGFGEFRTYQVRMPTAGRALRSRTGGKLVRSVATTFGTSDSYNDPVPGQPNFIGDHGTGLLGFDPPRHAASGLIDPDAAVVLEFSEPILASSLVPGTTVLVSHRATGASVPGTITKDPSMSAGGRRFLFVPTAGFGADPGDIQVALTTGITDLAGNPLQRPVGSASATP